MSYDKKESKLQYCHNLHRFADAIATYYVTRSFVLGDLNINSMNNGCMCTQYIPGPLLSCGRQGLGTRLVLYLAGVLKSFFIVFLTTEIAMIETTILPVCEHSVC